MEFEKITAKLIMDTSSGKDVITGNQKNNYINGKAGNDKLAGAGEMTLFLVEVGEIYYMVELGRIHLSAERVKTNCMEDPEKTNSNT